MDNTRGVLKPEVQWAKYEHRMRNMLLLYALACANTEDFEVDNDPVADYCDEEYALSLAVKYCGMDVDATFTLLEERVREGEGYGMAFGLTIAGDGGSVVGGMTPYNYSDDLWVYTKAALEDRFQLFEKSDPQKFVECIQEWAANHTPLHPEPEQLTLPKG